MNIYINVHIYVHSIIVLKYLYKLGMSLLECDSELRSRYVSAILTFSRETKEAKRTTISKLFMPL